MLGTVPVLKACKHPNICEGAEGNSMFILSVGMAEARAPVEGFRDETCKALFKRVWGLDTACTRDLGAVSITLFHFP